MESPPNDILAYRFGLFEAFPHSSELLRQGRRVKIQDLPFRLLLALLERPGEILSRELLRQRLWPEDTFVEFDQGLATAVAKLRQALDDDAANPRYIETLPKRGFRFIAPVTTVPQPLSPVAALGGVPPLPVASQEPAAQPAVTPSHSPSSSLRFRFLLLAAAALLLFSVAAFLYRRHSTFRLTPQGAIVLADFVNTTGDPVFDDSLHQALEVSMKQSPLVTVFPDRKSSITLKQMGISPEQHMTGQTAIEVCRRNGALLTVQGSISSLGTTYLIGLAAIRCDNAKLIANEIAESSRKEDVIDVLGKLASRLRARLGESLPSIEKYNAPLEQATTPSLDALNAYSNALLTWDRHGDRESLPFFQKAVSLDPNFAMAYSALSTVSNNLGQAQLARQYATKAYELRDRVTQAERASIEARYYTYITGELEKSNHVYELAAQQYPDSAGAWNHLANSQVAIALFDRAVDSYRQALRLDPTRATTYANLAQDLLCLNRLPEATDVLASADQRGFKTDFLAQLHYWIAFLHKDFAEMRLILEQSPSISGAQALLLAEQANTEAYYGHFAKADILSLSAAQAMEKDGDSESAASVLAHAALREAQAGSPARARSLLKQAQNLNATRVSNLAALILALDGDQQAALAAADTLNHQFPAGTLAQQYWLPLVRAVVELHRHHPEQAIEILEPARPLESVMTEDFYLNSWYPAFMRGQAYLAAGEGAKACAEFQKIIDNPGMVLNYPLGSLARLGLARGYAAQHDSAKARLAYQDFLALWKDADPQLAPLLQAKRELSALR
jgi:eukaryotic-like serine/threonine-protein kinase